MKLLVYVVGSYRSYWFCSAGWSNPTMTLLQLLLRNYSTQSFCPYNCLCFCWRIWSCHSQAVSMHKHNDEYSWYSMLCYLSRTVLTIGTHQFKALVRTRYVILRCQPIDWKSMFTFQLRFQLQKQSWLLRLHLQVTIVTSCYYLGPGHMVIFHLPALKPWRQTLLYKKRVVLKGCHVSFQGIVGCTPTYPVMGNPYLSLISWVFMGYNPQESLENTTNTIGTRTLACLSLEVFDRVKLSGSSHTNQPHHQAHFIGCILWEKKPGVYADMNIYCIYI